MVLFTKEIAARAYYATILPLAGEFARLNAASVPPNNSPTYPSQSQHKTD